MFKEYVDNLYIYKYTLKIYKHSWEVVEKQCTFDHEQKQKKKIIF